MTEKTLDSYSESTSVADKVRTNKKMRKWKKKGNYKKITKN